MPDLKENVEVGRHAHVGKYSRISPHFDSLLRIFHGVEAESNRVLLQGRF